MTHSKLANELCKQLIDRSLERIDSGNSIDLVSYMCAALDAAEIIENMEDENDRPENT